MKVLVTGGCGYIGSSIASMLIDNGYTPIILDSLINGQRAFAYDRPLYEGNIGNIDLLKVIFDDHPDITAVIHCAALIEVPDSVARPYEYYRENIIHSIEFFRFLKDSPATRVIFSSSASVYGVSANFEVTEESPIDPQSPYARSKWILEMVLQDFCHAYSLSAIALRYFNPAGADPNLRSGGYIRKPSHVLGRMLDVALGTVDTFFITGTDWPTRDGTGLRDYIHVWDLAQAHVSALEHFDSIVQQPEADSGYCTINIGTGNGSTVGELLAACTRFIGDDIPTLMAPPRPGDVAGSYANCDRAQRLLNWRAHYDLDAIIEHELQWRDRRKSLLGY